MARAAIRVAARPTRGAHGPPLDSNLISSPPGKEFVGNGAAGQSSSLFQGGAKVNELTAVALVGKVHFIGDNRLDSIARHSPAASHIALTTDRLAIILVVCIRPFRI